MPTFREKLTYVQGRKRLNRAINNYYCATLNQTFQEELMLAAYSLAALIKNYLWVKDPDAADLIENSTDIALYKLTCVYEMKGVTPLPNEAQKLQILSLIIYRRLKKAGRFTKDVK